MTDTPSLEDPDKYALDVITNAVRYTASLFLGVGKYDTREAESRDEIARVAIAMKADHPDVHSDPVITAFDAAGNSVVVSGKPYKKRRAANGDAEKIDTSDIPEQGEAFFAKAKLKRAKKAAPKKAAPKKAAPKKARRAAPPTHHGKRWTKETEAEWDAAAAAGKLPPAPDFSAPTHSNYRKVRDRIVTLAEAGDLAGLRQIEIRPISSSRVILHRYLAYVIRGLEARGTPRGRKRKAKEDA